MSACRPAALRRTISARARSSTSALATPSRVIACVSAIASTSSQVGSSARRRAIAPAYEAVDQLATCRSRGTMPALPNSWTTRACSWSRSINAPARARSRAAPSSSRNVTTQSPHADVACITHASHEIVNTSPSSIWAWFVQSLMPGIMNAGCRSRATHEARSAHQRNQLVAGDRVGAHGAHVPDDLLVIRDDDDRACRRQAPHLVTDDVVGDHVLWREHDAHDPASVGGSTDHVGAVEDNCDVAA